MVDLYPIPFADLIDRMHLEFARHGSIFDLHQNKWFIPEPNGPDLSVRFHHELAATPLGPAAGPHVQMAQNMVLAWLGGSRILELKTVQANDQVKIPRPCIDAANVCYNVEWSQELRLEQSLEQYVMGAMLIHMLRVGHFFDGVDMTGPHGATVLDMSVGYDLAGIQSPPVRAFMEGMKNAQPMIDRLRLHIPARYEKQRHMDYPTRLSSSITLSTFHGCPADEIERICEFLLTEIGVNVIIKMNPPMLGKERLESLLHDTLGYKDIRVNPSAYTTGLLFDEAVQLCDRLTAVARKHGQSLGAKFSNTLEVNNHRRTFTPDNKVMYLSGQPLHVIALSLAEEFRKAVGPDLPFTFSAGVDKQNFPDMVACGFNAVTTCTDLLRPGGYSRLAPDLLELVRKMQELGSTNISDYILDARGQREASGGRIAQAAAANLSTIAEESWQNPRYSFASNASEPRRIESHLDLFDCLTCDKCVAVCPNNANFIYEIPTQTIRFHGWRVSKTGSLEPMEWQDLRITKKHQIANFADFCNECGNCDTFCPEYGGPYIAKPSFFSSLESWRRHVNRDGFFVESDGSQHCIFGRIHGREYHLESHNDQDYVYSSSSLRVRFNADMSIATLENEASAGHVVDMWVAHTLRLLLSAMLNPNRVTQVNAGILAQTQSPI